MPRSIDLRAVLADERFRFLVVGGVNTGFAYVVFAVLVVLFEAVVHYTLLLVATHVISVLFAYVLHRTLVFRIRGRWLRDLPRYWSVHLTGLGLNLVLLPILVDVVGMEVLVGQAFALFATAALSYLGHKHFSFRRQAAEDYGPPPPRMRR